MVKINDNQHGHSFAKGAAIITLGMLAVKFFGAVFKIPLMSILGGEGSGYFIGAYNLYNPIYALSTAGLPIAISKIVSENVALNRFKDVKKIRRLSVPIFLMTGSIGFILIILGSFVYAKLSKAPDSIYSILMLAPALLFSCLMSSYRGYYEGLRNMTPTAVSEVIESVGKIIFGLSLSYLTIWIGHAEYMKKGSVFGIYFPNQVQANGKILSLASAAAILGIAISAFVGYLYINIRYKIKGDNITKDQIINSPKSRSSGYILKSILKVALPVGLGAIVMNLAGVVDSILIQRRLADIALTSMDKLKYIYGDLLPNEQCAYIPFRMLRVYFYNSHVFADYISGISNKHSSYGDSCVDSWETKRNKKKYRKNIENNFNYICSNGVGNIFSCVSYNGFDI